MRTAFHSLVMAFLVSISTLLAQTKGTYNFLRLDVSARAASLNGSFVSMTDDPNVLFYNPAALTTITVPRASANYLNHLMDVNAGSISYGQYLEGFGSIGAGVTFVNYGSITETDESMNILGSFSANEFAVVLGWGVSLDDETNVGISLKGIYSSIATYRSTAAAVDLGILHHIHSENITIGASILSIGRQFTTYNRTRESLPLDVKIGITKRPEHLPALLSLNFHKLNDPQNTLLQRFENFTVGVEFLMSESVRFRVGFNNEQRKELKIGTGPGLAGFSLGGGIIYDQYIIDYAFNSYGKIGGLHRISIGMSL